MLNHTRPFNWQVNVRMDVTTIARLAKYRQAMGLPDTNQASTVIRECMEAFLLHTKAPGMSTEQALNWLTHNGFSTKQATPESSTRHALALAEAMTAEQEEQAREVLLGDIEGLDMDELNKLMEEVGVDTMDRSE